MAESGVEGSTLVEASASGGVTKSGDKPTSSTEEAATLRSIVKQLSERLQQLETKLTALNDKIDATRSGVETLALEKAGRGSGAFPLTQSVAVHPNPVDSSRGAGAPATTPLPHSSLGSRAFDGATGPFVNDGPVSDYRKALLLLETGKTKESIQAFGKFIESHPDHVLAGSAQFHLGEAHFKNGDYASAKEELQRVLTTYDRSTFVPETLRLLTVASEHLHDEASATRHRQILLSRYPQSPSAKEFMNARTPVLAPIHSESPSALPVTEKSFDAEAAAKTPDSGLDSPPDHQNTSVIPTAPSSLGGSEPASKKSGESTGH